MKSSIYLLVEAKEAKQAKANSSVRQLWIKPRTLLHRFICKTSAATAALASSFTDNSLTGHYREGILDPPPHGAGIKQSPQEDAGEVAGLISEWQHRAAQ